MLSSRVSSILSQRISQISRAGFLPANRRNYAAGKKFLVINAVGLDRPGIVSEMSEMITNVGGNVGESRALRLGDHFSMMMLADVPEHESTKVKESLAGLNGIFTTTFDTSDPKESELSPKIGYKGTLTLTGADHPGILYKVAAVLSEHRLNIYDLETKDEPAPFGGSTLFHMKCTVAAYEPIAESFDIAVVEKQLENVAESLNCDIALT